MAVKNNIVIDQGADFQVTINVLDSGTSALSLEGFTGQAQLRKYYTSSKKHDFVVTVFANTGQVTLGMSSNTTANIASGRYVYDCVLKYENLVTRIAEGIVTINPRTTR